MRTTTRRGRPLSAAVKRGRTESRTAAEHAGHLRALLAIALMLLALALGSKVTEGSREGGDPHRLSSYEASHLEQVRYALWLDQARRGEVEP